MTSSKNRTISFVSSAICAALSAAPLATVKIVPSFGFITALYAVSTAFCTAWDKTGTVTSCSLPITFANPRKSWDKITPELPLAPRSEPEDIAFAIDTISGCSKALTSFAAARIVIDIFVPVSPSGTGNTFSSLIHSFLDSRFFAPFKNIFAKTAALIELISTSKSSLIDHSDAFNKNVDLFDVHSCEFFYTISDRTDQIIRYRTNADAI